VVIDGVSPSIVCSGKDPMGGTVLHAETEDVEMVIMDGII
jgi:hypothetical protein